MTKIVSVTNNKGGVGKTTGNILLASRLLDKGKKVLCVDLEYPGYLTRFFNQETSLSNDPAVMSLFKENIKQPFKISDNLSLFQCYDELAMVDSMGIEAVMNFKANLKSFEDQFDYIVIDTPPLLNNRLDCALNACSHVISVILPHEFAMDGMGSFLSRYNKTRSFTNQSLPKYPFVFFNMVMGTDKDNAALMDDFFKVYPSDFYTKNFLKKRKAIRDSISEGLAVWDYSTKKVIKDEVLNVFDDILNYLED